MRKKSLYTLSVTIGSARVPRMDFYGLADPFVTLSVVVPTGATSAASLPTTVRTRTLKRLVTPVWNETFEFGVAPTEDVLVLKVWDEDTIKDDLIGLALLPVNRIPITRAADPETGSGRQERGHHRPFPVMRRCHHRRRRPFEGAPPPRRAVPLRLHLQHPALYPCPPLPLVRRAHPCSPASFTRRRRGSRCRRRGCFTRPWSCSSPVSVVCWRALAVSPSPRRCGKRSSSCWRRRTWPKSRRGLRHTVGRGGGRRRAPPRGAGEALPRHWGARHVPVGK
eukprot:TRINITY_DN4098_c0_g1_i2.p1 TRINITY_DN4098_c0_g1~~TRINITY_DN4098_c0_g1_i2.p1  ORF type:complete len:280 (+),score=7.42 TRINITY_DN4098_c0_g1_i2:123-962(+)